MALRTHLVPDGNFWGAGWWFKPDYIINELNIQSTITSPAHEEVVPLEAGPTYTVRGYAFTGALRNQLAALKWA